MLRSKCINDSSEENDIAEFVDTVKKRVIPQEMLHCGICSLQLKTQSVQHSPKTIQANVFIWGRELQIWSITVPIVHIYEHTHTHHNCLHPTSHTYRDTHFPSVNHCLFLIFFLSHSHRPLYMNTK